MEDHAASPLILLELKMRFLIKVPANARWRTIAEAERALEVFFDPATQLLHTEARHDAELLGHS